MRGDVRGGEMGDSVIVKYMYIDMLREIFMDVARFS